MRSAQFKSQQSPSKFRQIRTLGLKTQSVRKENVATVANLVPRECMSKEKCRRQARSELFGNYRKIIKVTKHTRTGSEMQLFDIEQRKRQEPKC